MRRIDRRCEQLTSIPVSRAGRGHVGGGPERNGGPTITLLHMTDTPRPEIELNSNIGLPPPEGHSHACARTQAPARARTPAPARARTHAPAPAPTRARARARARSNIQVIYDPQPPKLTPRGAQNGHFHAHAHSPGPFTCAPQVLNTSSAYPPYLSRYSAKPCKNPLFDRIPTPKI